MALSTHRKLVVLDRGRGEMASEEVESMAGGKGQNRPRPRRYKKLY